MKRLLFCLLLLAACGFAQEAELASGVWTTEAMTMATFAPAEKLYLGEVARIDLNTGDIKVLRYPMKPEALAAAKIFWTTMSGYFKARIAQERKKVVAELWEEKEALRKDRDIVKARLVKISLNKGHLLDTLLFVFALCFMFVTVVIVFVSFADWRRNKSIRCHGSSRTMN